MAANLGGGFSPSLRNMTPYRFTRFSFDIVPRSGYSGFSPYLRLGGAEKIHLSEEPALEVTGPPAYWRGVVFHDYTGVAWETRKIATQDVGFSTEANGFLVAPWEYRRQEMEGDQERWLLISRSVKMLKPHANFLFSPWIPSRLSFGSLGTIQAVVGVHVLETPDGVLMTPFLPDEGFSYVIQSVSPLGEGLARPLDLPTQAIDYLALPEIPQRVRDLAVAQAGEGLPAEKMARLSAWIRENTRYAPQSDPLPPGRDAVDWFLFEIRTGWCEMYASSLAVLGRVVGVPTRVVGGYQPGEKTPGYRGYLIRDSDAHTWVEYWAGVDVGWVPTDPTPENSLAGVDASAEEGDTTPIGQARRAFRGFTEKIALAAWSNLLASFWDRARGLLLGLLALLLGFLGIRALLRKRPWSRRARLHRRFRAWERRALRWGLRRGLGETIHAFAHRWDRAGGPQGLKEEAGLFEAACYGRRSPL